MSPIHSYSNSDTVPTEGHLTSSPSILTATNMLLLWESNGKIPVGSLFTVGPPK